MSVVDLGIDKSEFRPPEDKYYFDNMLYYGNGLITDSYFLRNVYLYKDGMFTNKGRHVIYVLAPEVKEGNLLTTSPIKGVAIQTNDEVAAFAKVIKGSIKPLDRQEEIVLRAYVEFL